LTLDSIAGTVESDSGSFVVHVCIDEVEAHTIVTTKEALGLTGLVTMFEESNSGTRGNLNVGDGVIHLINDIATTIASGATVTHVALLVSPAVLVSTCISILVEAGTSGEDTEVRCLLINIKLS
jgi:hypothetical protein